MVKNTYHETPQYAIFSSLLWLSSSSFQFQVFPLEPLSQAPSLFLKIGHFYAVKYCRIGQNIFTLSKYTKFSGLSRGVKNVGEKCNENKCDIRPNTWVYSEDIKIFCQTFSLRSYYTTIDQFPFPHKTTGRMIIIPIKIVLQNVNN